MHAPSLVYRAVGVQGWYLYHWFDFTPLDIIRSTATEVLQMLGSGALVLPTAEKFAASDFIAAAARADSGKVLLDFK